MNNSYKKSRIIRNYQLTIDLWTWLAANPGKEKSDWPKYTLIYNLANNCPLCELYWMNDCIECPLSLSGNRCDMGLDETDYDDWYKIWRVRHRNNNKLKVAAGAALFIVEIVQKALNEYLKIEP